MTVPFIPPGASWTFGADRVARYGDVVMEKVISTFEVAGVSLPSRKFFTVGAPVYDCEELVITFDSLAKGFPGGAGEEPANCDMPSTVSFSVHLVRCFPIGNGSVPPSAQELTANADGLMVDAWLLLAAIDELNRDPLLGVAGMIYSVSVGEPQGGFVGVVAQVQAVVP